MTGTLRTILTAFAAFSAVTVAQAQQGSAPADAVKPPPAVPAPTAPTPQPAAPPAAQAPAAQPPAPANQAAPSSPAPAPAPAAQAPAIPPGTPATVLDTQDYDGVLGKPVRSAAGEDMGRIIDIIVDKDGRPRAAIIDFGGFLGVGSRKIAVDWRALHFSADNKPGRAVLQLNRNQVRVSPEYKPGDPIVVLGPAGPVPAPAQAAPTPAAPTPAAPTSAAPSQAAPSQAAPNQAAPSAAAPAPAVPATPPVAAPASPPAPDADQAASRNPPDK